MRARVLGDPTLASKLAGRFVRLDMNTETARGAAFAERYPIDAWPTLLVVDPATLQVVVRWAGNATAEQILGLARDGERALSRARGSKADTALARADGLAGERRHAEAAAAYAEALKAGGKAWPPRERVVEGLLQSLGFAGDAAGCAAAAERYAPAVRTASRRARVVAAGLGCALELPPRELGAALAVLEPQGRRLLAERAVLADDRSALFEVLSQARQAAGDAAGARADAVRWNDALEEEAGRARTPLERASLLGQRVAAALALGEPGRVLADAEAIEAALPLEFTPPALLAVLYLELDRPKDARSAANRALARAAGPRRVRVLVLRARAEEALGDRAGARATLEQAIREGEGFPQAVRPRRHLETARARLAKLGES